MKRFVYGILLGCLFSFVAVAAPQPPISNLPAAAQPGGALPQLSGSWLPKKVTVEKIKSKKEQDQGPAPSKDEPLINVRGFRVIGAIDHPNIGLTKKKIGLFLEQLRQQEWKNARRVKSAKTGKWEKGLTLVQIYKIANSLTLLYRSAGYIFTTVHVPPQTIGKDGIVTLKVVEGRLGQVTAKGNMAYKLHTLIWPFRDLINKPIFASDIESALLTINSFPGYRGHAVFVKGKKPGTTDIVLNTDEDRTAQLVFGADDSGTRLSGRNHKTVMLYLNNLTGGADRLRLMWVQNFRPNRGHYGGVSYTRRIFTPNLEFGLSYGRNSYSLGGSYRALGFYGVSNIGTASLTNTFVRTRATTFAAGISLSRKQAKTRYDGADYRRDNLTVAGANVALTQLVKTIHAYFTANLDYEHGFNNFLGAMDNHFEANTTPSSRQMGNGKYVGGYFNSLNLALSYLQGLFWGESLQLEFQGQYSPNALVSLQQMSLGGVNNVRAFPTSEYLADKGIAETAEWIIPMPFIGAKTIYQQYTWGQTVHFSLFADHAAGWLNHPSASDNYFVSIAGYGAGVEFNMPGKVLFQLQASRPFGFSRLKPTDHKDWRVWFNTYVMV